MSFWRPNQLVQNGDYPLYPGDILVIRGDGSAGRLQALGVPDGYQLTVNQALDSNVEWAPGGGVVPGTFVLVAGDTMTGSLLIQSPNSLSTTKIVSPSGSGILIQPSDASSLLLTTTTAGMYLDSQDVISLIAGSTMLLQAQGDMQVNANSNWSATVGGDLFFDASTGGDVTVKSAGDSNYTAEGGSLNLVATNSDILIHSVNGAGVLIKDGATTAIDMSSGQITVAGDMIASDDSLYSLSANSGGWKDLWLKGVATIEKTIELGEQVTPPVGGAAGHGQVYVKADGNLYFMRSDSTEFQLTP